MNGLHIPSHTSPRTYFRDIPAAETTDEYIIALLEDWSETQQRSEYYPSDEYRYRDRVSKMFGYKWLLNQHWIAHEYG